MLSSTSPTLSKAVTQQVLTVTLVAGVSFLLICYGLLWFLVRQQQQAEVHTFLNDVASSLNRKIDSGQTNLNEITLTPAVEIKSYELLVLTPDSHIVPIQQATDTALIQLPAWKLNNQQPQVHQHIDSFEAWYPLHNRARLYAHVEFNDTWDNFNHPLYALPLLWLFCLMLLINIQLRKRHHNWQALTQYIQQLLQNISMGYQPLLLNYHHSQPELRYFTHLLNRLSYKMTQYFEQYNELFYRQNNLIDNAPVPLFLLSRKGKLLYFNEKFAQLFATPYDPNVTYMLNDFVTGTDKDTQQRLHNLQAYQILGTLAVTNLQYDSHFDLHLIPFYNQFGRLKGFSGSLQIVTHYHERLQQAWLEDRQYNDKIASFDKLWAVLGHELRTPLSGMIGMIELLSEDKNQLNQEQQETLTTLQQSSQTMLQLLNDMLDMAKMDAGKLQSNITSVNLLQLLTQVADLMVGNAKRHHISLYIIADPMIPHYFDSDDGRLRQILLNLMSNAIKFTKQGYVALLVDKLTRDHPVIKQKMADRNGDIPDDWLRMTVKDTGIGILQKEQKKLFSYFNQANDSISQQFGGTGLGLAISNNFSQMLGGFIHLESEAGQGSEFQVYLPMSKFSIQPAFDFRVKHLKVFLILISPFEILQSFKRFLQYYDVTGIIITTIDDSMVARLNAINFLDLTPVFIIDDVGYIGNESLFRAITAFNSSHKILCSMESERTLSSELLMQFDGYVPKPVTISGLLAEVSRLYNQSRNPIQGLSSLPAQAAFRQFLQQYGELPDKTQLPMLPPATIRTTNSQLAQDDATTSPDKIIEQANNTVLLAEDNPVNQKIAKKQLTNLGYEVLIADNGQAAIELLKQHRHAIRLILMDCRMPILDGFEATRAIRASKDSIPIIALTANDTDDDRKACIAAGMDNFLTKPLNKERLATLLNRYLI